MSIDDEFEKAKEKVAKKSGKLSQDKLLTFYGLFKQSTVGNCNTSKPGLFNFKKKAKWESWKSRKSMSKEGAMK